MRKIWSKDFLWEIPKCSDSNPNVQKQTETDLLKSTKYGKFPMILTANFQVNLVHSSESILIQAKTVSAKNSVTIFRIKDQMVVSTGS